MKTLEKQKTVLEKGIGYRAMKLRFTEARLTRHRINLEKYDKRGRYVGYSLSSCVHDILDGYMPLECVVGMTTSTRITSIEVMHKWIEGCRESTTYSSNVTRKPFDIEEYIEVFNHILFRCRFIQYRMHGDWAQLVSKGGYQFTGKGHMANIGEDRSSWLRVDHKKFRKYITDNSPTNDLKTKVRK